MVSFFTTCAGRRQFRQRQTGGQRRDIDGSLNGFQVGNDLFGAQLAGGQTWRTGFFVGHNRLKGDVDGFNQGFEGKRAGKVELEGDSLGLYGTLTDTVPGCGKLGGGTPGTGDTHRVTFDHADQIETQQKSTQADVGVGLILSLAPAVSVYAGADYSKQPATSPVRQYRSQGQLVALRWLYSSRFFDDLTNKQEVREAP